MVIPAPALGCWTVGRIWAPAAGLPLLVIGLIIVVPVRDFSIQHVLAILGLIQAEREVVEPFPCKLLSDAMHHLIAQDEGVWKEVDGICTLAFTSALTTGSSMVTGGYGDLRHRFGGAID
jgi:hypothetical protein